MGYALAEAALRRGARVLLITGPTSLTPPGAAEVTLEELVAFLAERNIAKMKFPERLVVVSEMPLTPTRKIIKGKLKIPD